MQDHNKDYIVEFPDIYPFLEGSQPPQRRIKDLLLVKKNHRFSLKETSNDLPQPHLWYSTKEVISALKLFLDGGNDLSESLTYRLVHMPCC